MGPCLQATKKRRLQALDRVTKRKRLPRKPEGQGSIFWPLTFTTVGMTFLKLLSPSFTYVAGQFKKLAVQKNDLHLTKNYEKVSLLKSHFIIFHLHLTLQLNNVCTMLEGSNGNMVTSSSRTPSSHSNHSGVNFDVKHMRKPNTQAFIGEQNIL